MAGALEGLKIVELAGIGPGPFAGMMLADHGAEVIRVERPGFVVDSTDVLARSRTRIALDLKDPAAIEALRELVRSADALIEGFRPGVMERLGLGPEVLLKDNPRLVYGRVTGWGQEGRLAKAAGHDINYIALTGALNAFGRTGEKPTPPINMVGDFGGGGMMMAFGLLAGILFARRTGQGQVIDCAMTDGASLQMSMIWGFRNQGIWNDERGTNYLDTGAPYYDTYETADGKYVAIGSIEPQFYAQLLEKTGLAEDPIFAEQNDPATLEARRERLSAVFASKTRQEWCEIMEGTDVCFAPVLDFNEAPNHAQNRERCAFIELDGVCQPAPAPRFSLTPAPAPRAPGR
ncbi:CaiB/BaiF CoA-transferase family protein [Novosphingobium sp. KN65.2]|uniref:CaiB/BaiF CoA transferase family protein n=1 Tax=Novosphingobium sp. KN65.2 TaxID=1478134 RepID=UPI0005E3C667|nr:CaiB/BaiF CoA-transferase family protein [Novosphingobium sp. KN65.2]CDO37844.1 Putative Alpha-methylacyl-CoA racemase (2-methylacyl-CoA racemase) (2-arylpropionyl-CoA epimerase) [Novosphingobium sp. KN65.2]